MNGDMTALDRAVHNATGLWTRLADARGYPVTRRRAYLALDGTGLSGLRIFTLTGTPKPDERDEILALASRQPPGEVTVEDAYGVVEPPLNARRMPVMIRDAAPLSPPSLPVERVDDPERLAIAEQIVVHGFPLANAERYAPGQALPPSLLDTPGFDVFLALREGVPAGACVTILDQGTAGVYWVTTLPEHRSRGVGRALMHAALEHVSPLPMTLTAAKAGVPLYRSLGFTTITEAAWWS